MTSGSTYRARSAQLVVEHVGDEVLVYDQRSDVAHCLTSAAAAVWRRCEEADADLVELGMEVGALRLSGNSEALVLAALAELCDADLVHRIASPPGVYDRRQAAVRLAKIGAAAAGAPLIFSSIIHPAPALASPGTCSSPSCGRGSQNSVAEAKALADADCVNSGCTQCDGSTYGQGGYFTGTTYLYAGNCAP